jgi:hypothetical protein
MTEYRGSRDADGNATVIVVNDDGRRRPLSHFARHSPSGFEWGFAGSGPADLARSILAHHLGGRVAPPARVYQLFKCTVVAGLPKGEWRLTSDDIASWLQHELRSIGVNCPRCADQGALWPEQRMSRRPGNRAEHCDCEAGRVLSEIPANLQIAKKQ